MAIKRLRKRKRKVALVVVSPLLLGAMKLKVEAMWR
jgi:hypothetical protein